MVGAVALVAGADWTLALRAAAAMVALQVSIGALNDIVDIERDAGRKLAKPIPAGLVSRRAAQGVAVGAAVVGLALSATLGPPVLAVAVMALALGYGYDLWARGTAWSWLPFVLALPLLPAYGWLAATGGIPSWFAIFGVMAALAGMALAIANAVADAERDREAGVESIALALGPGRSFAVGAAVWVATAAVALGSLAVLTAILPWGVVIGVAVGVAIGAARVAVGRDPAARERAWEVQAVAVAVAGVAWLLGIEVVG